MIGIIVSGSAVPTAASTDPTAPSASSSFRPNHSMLFVNSSATRRMTTNAATRMRMSTSALELERDRRQNAEEDDDKDQDRDEGHARLATALIPHQRRGDPRRRCRENDDEPEPQESGRPERHEVSRERADVERWTTRERSDAVRQHQREPDREERDRGIRPGRQQPADGPFEPRIGTV